MKNSTYEILGIGTPVIDHILKVDEKFLNDLPGPKGGMEPVDAKTFAHILQTSHTTDIMLPGGSCSNTIRGLANLKHQCAMVGKIGKDSAAEYFLNVFHELKIKSLFMETKTPTTQVASLVAPDGKRTMKALLNASLEMTGNDLNPEIFQNVKLVHIEGYTLLSENLTLKAMQLAKQSGALISFDLASFEVVKKYRNEIFELLNHYVDIVFANEDEILALTNEPAEKGCALLKDICSIVIVLKGKLGCIVGSSEGIDAYPALPIENPLDTTGAGDLFASGFLHGYLSGKSIEEAAYYGAVLGSEVVQILGADMPQETWDKVKRIFHHREHKERE